MMCSCARTDEGSEQFSNVRCSKKINNSEDGKTNQDNMWSHSRHGKRRVVNARMQDGHGIEATGDEGARALRRTWRCAKTVLFCFRSKDVIEKHRKKPGGGGGGRWWRGGDYSGHAADRPRKRVNNRSPFFCLGSFAPVFLPLESERRDSRRGVFLKEKNMWSSSTTNTSTLPFQSMLSPELGVSYLSS